MYVNVGGVLGVCQAVEQLRCRAKTALTGDPVDFQGGTFNGEGGIKFFQKIFQPSKISLPLHKEIYQKNIPALYKFHTPPPPRINWCVPKWLVMKIAS